MRSGAISRILCNAGLRRRRGSHSSRPRIAAGLKPPTRRLARAALGQRCRWRVCLFGVAPDGGCRVSRPHRSPGAYSSLWPCSSRHRARPLDVIPPYGVRTFLDARSAPRLPTPLRISDYRGFTLRPTFASCAGPRFVSGALCLDPEQEHHAFKGIDSLPLQSLQFNERTRLWQPNSSTMARISA